jgi:hypothetical protein
MVFKPKKNLAKSLNGLNRLNKPVRLESRDFFD